MLGVAFRSCVGFVRHDPGDDEEPWFFGFAFFGDELQADVRGWSGTAVESIDAIFGVRFGKAPCVAILLWISEMPFTEVAHLVTGVAEGLAHRLGSWCIFAAV